MADTKTFTRKELIERNTKSDALFVIDNKVYDVTKFLDDHPGGHEVLLNVAGKDASEDFDDVGHSLDAKELMVKYLVGEVVPEDRIANKQRNVSWDGPGTETSGGNDFLSSWKLPVVLGLVMTLLYSYLFG